jgi:hypothetical protein
MRLFLDTRDLINLLERGEPCSTEAFSSLLRSSGSVVVFSLTHLGELAAPLELAGNDSAVMATLNRVETWPLLYVDEQVIPYRELQVSMDAFLSGRELPPVDPFVSRPGALVPDRRFLNYSLAELAFEIWRTRPDALRKKPAIIDFLRRSFTERRSAPKTGGDIEEFAVALNELASRFRINRAGLPFGDFARWVWQDSSRCPGISLWFEVRHQLVRNVRDTIKDSDPADLSWLWLLPYVSLATLDDRMRDYVQRVTRKRQYEGVSQIVPSVREVSELLKRSISESVGAPPTERPGSGRGSRP